MKPQTDTDKPENPRSSANICALLFLIPSSIIHPSIIHHFQPSIFGTARFGKTYIETEEAEEIEQT